MMKTDDESQAGVFRGYSSDGVGFMTGQRRFHDGGGRFSGLYRQFETVLSSQGVGAVGKPYAVEAIDEVRVMDTIRPGHEPEAVIDGGLADTIGHRAFPGTFPGFLGLDTIGDILLADLETVAVPFLLGFGAVGQIPDPLFSIRNGVSPGLAFRLFFSLLLFSQLFRGGWIQPGAVSVSDQLFPYAIGYHGQVSGAVGTIAADAMEAVERDMGKAVGHAGGEAIAEVLHLLVFGRIPARPGNGIPARPGDRQVMEAVGLNLFDAIAVDAV